MTERFSGNEDILSFHDSFPEEFLKNFSDLGFILVKGGGVNVAISSEDGVTDSVFSLVSSALKSQVSEKPVGEHTCQVPRPTLGICTPFDKVKLGTLEEEEEDIASLIRKKGNVVIWPALLIYTWPSNHRIK